MKHFLYVRKSSEGEDRQALSIESQIDTLTDLAKRRGIVISRTFKESKSAKEPGRATFNEMMDRLAAKEADGIICWKLDRLARNPIDAGRVQWALQKGEIKRIITPDRDYLPEENALLQSVEFGMANQFILDHRKNVNRGMDTKVKMGWFPEKPPVGYINEPIERTIVPDPHNFPLVRQLLHKALTGAYTGLQLSEIACELGIRRRIKGKLSNTPLARSQIYELLRSPFYAGFFDWKGERYNGSQQPMINKTEHEKLVEMFRRIKGVQPDYQNNSRRRHRHKLSGLIKCSCGKSVIPWYAKNRQTKGKTYLYFTCSSRFYKNLRGTCNAPAIRGELCESLIRKELEKIALPAPLLAWAKERMNKIVQGQQIQCEEQLTAIQTRIKGLRTRRDKLIDFVLDSGLSVEEFKEKKVTIEQEIADLESQEKDVEQEKLDAKKRYTKTIDLLTSILKIYDEGNETEVKTVIKTISERITMKDGGISLEAKKPFTEIIDLSTKKEDGAIKKYGGLRFK